MELQATQSQKSAPHLPVNTQAAAKGKGPAVGRSGALVQPDGHLSDLKRKLLEGDR